MSLFCRRAGGTPASPRKKMGCEGERFRVYRGRGQATGWFDRNGAWLIRNYCFRRSQHLADESGPPAASPDQTADVVVPLHPILELAYAPILSLAAVVISSDCRDIKASPYDQ